MILMRGAIVDVCAAGCIVFGVFSGCAHAQDKFQRSAVIARLLCVYCCGRVCGYVVICLMIIKGGI